MHGPTLARTRRRSRNGRTRPRALKNRLARNRPAWRRAWPGSCGLNWPGRSRIHGTRARLRHDHARRGSPGSLRTGRNRRLRPNCGWRWSLCRWRCCGRLRSRRIGGWWRGRRLNRWHNHGTRGLRRSCNRRLRNRRPGSLRRRRFRSRWSGWRSCCRPGFDGRNYHGPRHWRNRWRSGARRRRRRRCRRVRLCLLLPKKIQNIARLGDVRKINLGFDFVTVMAGGALWLGSGVRFPLPLEVSTHLVRFVILQRTGMGLFLGDTDCCKHIENRPALDFQLSSQIVDSNLAHPPSIPPQLCC